MDSEQDKSEAPTSHKLMRSRRKGVVARGTDLGFLAGLAAFAAFAWISGGHVAADMTGVATETIITAPQVASGPEPLLGLSAIVLGRIVRPLLLAAGSVFLAVLVLELAQTGPLLSTAPLKPDFSRLNPASGLKRLFSVRLIVETLKNLLKLAAYSAIATIIVRQALRDHSAALTDARQLSAGLAGLGFRLLVEFAGAACLFAVLDQFLARRLFHKRMRMSRRELRREHRDREGEPRIKQRRKQLHAQLVKLSQALKAVPGADVVITNPTHLAIALSYQSATMDAPVVVASGANRLAARIRGIAFNHGVVVIEDKPLARDLFRRCPIGHPVPEDQYRRVASIYRKLPRKNVGDANA